MIAATGSTTSTTQAGSGTALGGLDLSGPLRAPEDELADPAGCTLELI